MAKVDWPEPLRSCPTQPWEGPLYRFVAKQALDGGKPPNYLFTSGARNRCNPAGVHCLYLAEDASTALTEYEKYFSDVPPSVLYRVELKAAAIIDLCDPETSGHLSLTEDDLFGSFRLKSSPTPLEKLGQLLSRQTHRPGVPIVAMRFPSAACQTVGKTGNNLAVFKAALAPPDSLQVHDPDNDSPDRWP